MTPSIYAAHMEAAINRAAIAAGEADDDVVHAAIDNMKQPESAFGDPFERQVTDRFVELLDTSADDANIEDL